MSYADFDFYNLKVNAVVKTFLSQKTDSAVSPEEHWSFEISTVAEFHHELWPKVRPFVKREIYFVEKKPFWSEKEIPDEEDLSKFVLLFDPKSRRSFDVAGITLADLARWDDERVMVLTICEYSVAVHSKPAWTSAEKSLILPAERDRSGAAAEAEIGRLVDKLKDQHQFHYQAQYITWRQWADYVLKQPGHTRERSINNPPPQHLIHLFSCAKEPADTLVSELRQNVNIGEGVNQSFSDQLVEMRAEFNKILRLSGLLQEAIQSFDVRLSSMEQRCENNRENISLFQAAVKPTESSFGRDMFEKIIDQEDVDHT